MDNAAVARAMTSEETYERIIEVYKGRRHAEPYRTLVDTCERQLWIKRAEASA